MYMYIEEGICLVSRNVTTRNVTTRNVTTRGQGYVHRFVKCSCHVHNCYIWEQQPLTITYNSGVVSWGIISCKFGEFDEVS